MTEEIIIDGVNVAKCKQLIEDYQQCNRIEGKYEHIFNVCELGERGTEDYFMSCRDNPNCYYKQLKRLEQKKFALTQESQQKSQMICELEQENKELKEKYTHVLELAKTNADSNEYCLQELEKENKELKNIIKIHDSTKYDYYKLMKENEEWHIKYAGCNTANSAIQEENKKYRSALEEIRNIIINDNSVIIDKKAYFELQCGEPIALKLQKIYNKINEVLEK